MSLRRDPKKSQITKNNIKSNYGLMDYPTFLVATPWLPGRKAIAGWKFRASWTKNRSRTLTAKCVSTQDMTGQENAFGALSVRSLRTRKTRSRRGNRCAASRGGLCGENAQFPPAAKLSQDNRKPNRSGARKGVDSKISGKILLLKNIRSFDQLIQSSP